MDIKMQIQSTPNPNALKFVLNITVKTEGKIGYKSAAECEDNPLAKALFEINHLSEVYFFDNYITVTQDGSGDWDEIENKVQSTILKMAPDHDPNFKTPTPVQENVTGADQNDPDIAKINSILDETIRPALQMDGGDLSVVALEGNILKVNYHGACGSCPSAAMGTLKAVENILRDGFNPELVVEIA
jgi:Fe-S cluster biogenesis protein NfuA